MKLINSDDKPSNHDKNFQQRGYPIRTTLKKKKKVVREILQKLNGTFRNNEGNTYLDKTLLVEAFHISSH